MTNLFVDLLEKEMNTPTDNNMDICLISREPLNDTCVILPCKHKYNYYSIYRELINQRIKYRLKKPRIQCPYCRTNHTYVLPYIIKEGVEKIKWINSPAKHQLLPNKCTYIFKNNKKVCNKSCMHEMCPYHTKITTTSVEELNNITSDSNLHVYTVVKLKSLAKYKKIKGYSTLKKSELILLIQQSMS